MVTGAAPAAGRCDQINWSSPPSPRNATTARALVRAASILTRLRTMLREHGVGDVVVKKRGIAVEPEELRHRLRLDGRGPMRTLVLTRIGADPFAILCDPAP